MKPGERLWSETTLEAHPSPALVGSVLGGKYRVERIVGRGGMGVVVAAKHELLGHAVAIKLLLPERVSHEAIGRLLREARAVAKLTEALALLARHPWPGNVRELRNVIEHAVLMSDAVVELAHLPPALRRQSLEPPPPAPAIAPSGDETPDAMRGRVQDLEKKSIEDALAACGGNRTQAASKLGISRGSLAYKMAKYRIA